MSSILKALKKLDAQKSPVETTGPDLSNSQESLASQPRPWLPLGAGVALGGLMVAALIVWYEKPATVAPDQIKAPLAVAEHKATVQPGVKLESPTSIPPSAFQVEATPSPAVPVSAQPTVKPPESPTATAKFDPVVVPVPTQITRIDPVIEQASPKKPLVASPAGVDGKTTPAVIPAATVKTSNLPASITLVVSDIYFQEDSTDNMAVVNDLPVMEGTQIEGAFVEKIFADRVVFKIDGKRYDILPSSSGQ